MYVTFNFIPWIQNDFVEFLTVVRLMLNGGYVVGILSTVTELFVIRSGISPDINFIIGLGFATAKQVPMVTTPLSQSVVSLFHKF